MQDELLRTDWKPIITSTIDDAYALFITKVFNNIDKFAPEKTVTIPNKQIIRQPWMSKGLMMSSRMKDMLFRKCTNKSRTCYLYVQFIKYRNIYTKLKKTSKTKYYTDLFEQYKHDFRKTWQILNSLVGIHQRKALYLILSAWTKKS